MTPFTAEHSPTKARAPSPLLEQQRSIGRSLSLGDKSNFFCLGAVPIGATSDNEADSPSAGEECLRPRADTASAGPSDSARLERVSRPNDNVCGVDAGDGDSSSDNVTQDKISGGTSERGSPGGTRRGSGVVADFIAKHRERSPRRPAAPESEVSKSDVSKSDVSKPPPELLRSKGKKPPRVPRMKRMASADAGDASGRGKTGVCKVS